MSAVRFVWPFGLVFLEWYVGDLLRRGAESVLVRVPSWEVGNYLVRMRLVEAFDEETRASFDVPRDRVRERDRRDVLVELRRFAVLNDDEVEDLALQLVRVARENGGEALPFEPLFLTISEVISNVQVHSGENGGTVAVQRYQDRVCLAFGDAGVGIPGRLGRRLPGASDSAVIEHALEEGVSTRAGRGGMGLTELADLVAERDGRLVIHSAAGQALVNRRGVSRQDGCCPLEGTLVEVEV